MKNVHNDIDLRSCQFVQRAAPRVFRALQKVRALLTASRTGFIACLECANLLQTEQKVYLSRNSPLGHEKGRHSPSGQHAPRPQPSQASSLDTLSFSPPLRLSVQNSQQTLLELRSLGDILQARIVGGIRWPLFDMSSFGGKNFQGCHLRKEGYQI